MIFRTTIGQPAEGASYLARPYLDDRFWKSIQNGSHLLVSAPRRVGKTSFLRNTSNEDFQKKYLTTESINRPNEFFKRLYKSLLEDLSAQKKMWEGIADLVKRNRIEKIGTGGIEIKGEDLDYFEELKLLIQKTEFDKPMVFIVDEFSETLENIITDQGESAGKNFLHQNRELRQDAAISKKIQFVYSGSIGLGNIAEHIGASKTINDLKDFKIPPFSEKEAANLIPQLTIEENLDFPKKTLQHLFEKIHWLIPFYIQIILDEIEDILMQQDSLSITKKMIDQAMKSALETRNYFEHWHTRLRTTYQGNDYTFAKESLNLCATLDGALKSALYDLAAKYEVEENYKSIIRSLEYDGYISMNEDGIYLFNSPLLRAWWERNIVV